ncbi:MAG: biopolymer transporter ExbD [Proteobacteria bacterium]|nr:biopolymer transporter ExbD [Pseudomonadota bacterium]MBU1231406.1 biopolymer transporter ExbD [Pseudomonadota bacterium]MBU1418483.1 biopolymer transporter ExbD [Pseudomonadota bacterium]MBU1455012.1 biopolymer transporter ExbD [Pseudomonadota bacterium]
MKLRRNTIQPARIEMLPLIDIVFLLLVFFIYAMLSMAVHHSLPVQLPSATTLKVDTSETVAVSVMAGPDALHLAVNGEAMDVTGLTARLQQLSHGDRQCQVQIFADKDVSYQQLFQVLDNVQAAGLHSISLVGEQEPAK